MIKIAISEKAKNVTIVIVLFVLAFLVRIAFLTSNSLGNDEPFSVFVAQKSISQIFAILTDGNNPPLYELLLHFWIRIFGTSEFWVRLPSLIFNCFAVVYIFKFTKLFFNVEAAILASLLFVFSNYQIAFAHEARVYSLVGMLSIASMYYFASFISTPTRKIKLLIALILTNILLIYAHYLGFFILFVEAVVFLCHSTARKKYRRELLLALAIIVFAYLPVIPVVVHRFLITSSVGTWIRPPDSIDNIYLILWAYSNSPLTTVASILILISGVIVFFIKSKRQTLLLQQKLVVAWFVLPITIMFVISFIIPMFTDRYVSIIAIPYYILIAIVSCKIIDYKKFRYVLPMLMLLMFAFTVKPDMSNRRNTQEAVSQTLNFKKEKSLVMFCPRHFKYGFAYYFSKEAFRDDANIGLDQELRQLGVVPVDSIVQVDFRQYDHIVYLDAAADYCVPGNRILDSLNANYRQLSCIKVYEIFTIYEFER